MCNLFPALARGQTCMMKFQASSLRSASHVVRYKLSLLQDERLWALLAVLLSSESVSCMSCLSTCSNALTYEVADGSFPPSFPVCKAAPMKLWYPSFSRIEKKRKSLPSAIRISFGWITIFNPQNIHNLIMYAH